MDKQPCIAVCTPWQNRPEGLFAKCFIDLLQAVPRPFELFIRHERPVADARNELTQAALSLAHVTHLFWVDDDMTFRPDYIRRLLEHDLPVVGGLCFNRRSPYHPVLAKAWHPGSGLEEGYGWIYDPPYEGLVEVDGTGAAFLLVKREVFEKIGKDWWTEMDDISEDLSFCRRVRRAGFPIKVDCGVEVGHLGQVIVDRAFAERNRTVEVLRWTPFGGVRPGKPQATIVIPTYNQQPEYLRAAVKSALEQTVPCEVIVVDDGSEIAASIPLEQVALAAGDRLRILRHGTNQGIAAALNTGIEAMRTDWFAWLSSDDLFDPRKVEIQLGQMLGSDTLASFHRYNAFADPDGKSASLSTMVAWRTPEDQRAMLSQGCFINGSTVMLHRQVFQEVGRFDTSYRYAQDWEFWNRVAQQFLWHPINMVLGSRREFQNLTEEIAKDPEKTKVMIEEQQRIVEKYAPRCPHCSEQLVQPFALGRAGT